jgi:hypothetical protein
MVKFYEMTRNWPNRIENIIFENFGIFCIISSFFKNMLKTGVEMSDDI